MNRDLATAYVEEAFSGNHRAMLLGLLEPSIRIIASAHPYDGGTLRSKFGGDPVLPEGFVWPSWDARAWTDRKILFFEERSTGRSAKWALDAIAKLKNEYPMKPIPLSFIAQIDLEEACPPPSLGLPSAGRLLFFYDALSSPWGFDPATRGAARVIFVADAAGEIHQPTHEGVRPPTVFKTASLSFELEWNLPSCIENGPPELSNYRLNHKYRDLAQNLVEDSSVVHRLRGHDQPIQGDMKLEAQLVSNGLYCGDPSGYKDPRVESLRAGAEDWVLLLQVDTDENGPGWMWGDAGRLYYWIRRQDLAERDFSQVWATEQCY